MNATNKFHSPGPWHAGHIGEAEYRHEVVFDGNSGQVCEVTMPGVQGVHNARLIAAAPALLAACEARVNEWHADARNMERAEPESVRLARAALFLARGS